MRLLLVNLTLLACLFGLSTFIVPVSAAPVPKDEPNRPKTTAEKLVGTWKQVKLNGQPRGSQYETIFTFSKDGKMTIRRNYDLKTGRKGIHEEAGAYKVVGNKLHMFSMARPRPTERHWYVLITKITTHKFACLGPDSPASEENVLKRIEPR